MANHLLTQLSNPRQALVEGIPMAANPGGNCIGCRCRRRFGAIFFLALGFFTGREIVWGEEPPANPKKDPPAAAPNAPPAAPAPAVPAKPPAGAQIQIQVQGGQGGGQIQINGGIIQVQGNAKVQVQANGNVVIGGGAAPADGNSSETLEDTVFRSPDRTLQQRLTRSEELITEERYAEAVEMLGGILEQAEDYFFRKNRSTATSRSLKAEAQRRIGSLPPAGRDAYELQYGAKAKQMLEAAVDKGDEQGLAETSRRYFHTQAGLRATYLLGLAHFDHGRPLAAALCWRRLRELPAASEFEPELSLQLAAAWSAAGQTQAALAVVQNAAERFPGAVFNIGGDSYRWQGSPEKTLAWLAQINGSQVAQAVADDGRKVDRWLLVGGSAARNAVSAGSNPLLNRRWAVPYVNHPDVEKLADQLARNFNEQAVLPLPASQPLAVNDVVLMRTFTGLAAVDFRTGKRIWRGASDEHVEQLLHRDAPLAGRQDQEAGQLAYLLEERVWRDAAYGTFSSDGKNVFCIEEAIAPNQSAQRTTINFNGRRIMPGTQVSSNRLAAYDLATEGKLLWELGGSETVRAGSAEDDANASERVIFLGPPLPMGDRLFVLGESKGEIRLYVLHAATGKLDWSQQLALAPEGFDSGVRRSCGLSPSYADGVLLCPTTLGAVVAVDLNDRALLWGFQYKHQGTDGMSRQRMFVWQMQQQNEAVAEGDKWHDALLTVADGKILIAPPDGDQLTCISLVDGSKIWEKPRNKGLYVACVHDGKAIVVAGDAIRAYQLQDGKEIWTRTWPDPAKPSGRGFFNGRFYFAPLSTGEVAAVDLGGGQIVARSKSRSGTIPGNLVCYHGAVLSQGVQGLECFYQLEDLRREVIAKLKERPDDPQALSSQGELLLDEGKTSEAIEVLRKSYAAAADPRTRNLLIDALLEGLGSGLVSSATDMADLEKLASGTLREESYLRLRAEAHERAKDDRQALAVYLRLIDLPASTEEPVRKTSNVAIGRARWVKAKLKSLSDRADDEGKKAIVAATDGRRQIALESTDLSLMRNYLEYFGDQAASDQIRLRLAGLTAEKGNLLEAEMLYSHAALGSDATAAEATARLARLFYVDAGRAADAVPSLRRLEGEFAAVKDADGLTGKQVVEKLLPSGGVEKLAQSHPWPVGKVDVVEVRHQANSTLRSVPLEFRGPRGPYFENLIIEMEQTQQQIVIRDADGVERQRVTLVEPAQRRHVNQMNPMVSHLRAIGHLLIVSMGHEIVAIDTLSDGPSKAKILWRHDLTDTLMGMNGLQNIHPRVVQMPWGVPRFMAADGNGRAIGATGPATTKYVSYLRQRSLYLVDPLTGKTLWVRNDVDPGSDLFGDEEYLFVTPTNNGTGERTWVLRVADGEKVKEVRLSRAEQRVAAYGRRLLTWAPENGKMTIKLVDAFEEKTIWSQTFTPDARLWPIGSDEIAVFTRAGKLAVLNVADGAKRLEATVIPEPQLSESYVLRTADAYLLITSSPLRQRDGVNIQPVPGGFGNPLINGYVYGFDRKTQKERFKTHVQGHGLTLNQPADLPVLVFASQIYEQPKKGQMRQPEAALFVVDKRNGRVVYDKRMPAPLNMVELNGETGKNMLQLRTLRNTLQFTFTDEPIVEDEKKPVENKANDKQPDENPKPAKVGAAGKPQVRALDETVVVGEFKE